MEKFVLLFVVCIACADASSLFANRHSRFRHVGALNEGLLRRGAELRGEQDPIPGQLFFTQKLSHTNLSDPTTFQQRYLVNSTYTAAEDSPVFLILGGEGPISEHYVTGHFIVNQLAQIHGAKVYALEHRFYGVSVPLNDSSTANLRYLSSEAALWDAAAFVSAMQSAGDKGKWVVFGGSYSGNLAAWAKLKFPSLYSGSWAASAPVLAELDFQQYFEVVSRSVGESCSNVFASASTQISSMLSNDEGKRKLEQLFNTCSPIVSDLDAANFVSGLTGGPSGVVQYNADNVDYQPFGIGTMCDMLESSSANPLIAWANLTAAFQGGECLEVNYTSMIEQLQATGAGRSWTYQTCKEFGYFQAADGANQPFPVQLTLDFSLQICADLFNDGQPLQPNTSFTNAMYQNVEIQTENTFMANGNVDPWHTLGTDYVNTVGPGRDIGPGSMSLLINGTAHCADLYEPRSSDVPGLQTARQLEYGFLDLWLQ